MRYESPWTVLGLAPDADEAAVRAAYAALLKRTNPEDDAEGFKRLRAAYEQALLAVESRQYAQEFEDAEAEYEASLQGDGEAPDAHTDDLETLRLPRRFGQIVLDPPRSFDPPSSRPDDEAAQASAADIQSHTALRTELFDALKNAGAPDVLRRTLDAVLNAPAMSRVDVFDRTGVWLVDLVHMTRPASHVLVDRIIEFFGWKPAREELHQWQGPRAMFALRDFIRGEEKNEALLARLEDPRHEFHRAYVLTRKEGPSLPDRPFPQRLWALRHINLVERFLATLELRHRSLLARLDARTIGWWKLQTTRSSLPFSVLRNARAIFLALTVIAAVFVAGNNIEPRELDLPSEAASAPRDRSLAREACAYLARASAEYPSDPQATFAAARRQCGATLQLMPEALSMHTTLGLIELKAGDPVAALREFTLVLGSSPNDSVALYGSALARGGSLPQTRASDVAADMERALALSPRLREYFHSYQIVTPSDVEAPPGPRLNAVDARPAPAFDTAPIVSDTLPANALDDALDYFGIGPMNAQVVLSCLANADGRLSDCKVWSQSYIGAGEVALCLAPMLRATPATRGGVALDGIPVRVPIRMVR